MKNHGSTVYPDWAADAEVIDNTEDIGIFLTQEDCEKGVAENGECCAFGRAALRAMGGTGRAYFYKTTALIKPDPDGPVFRFRIPPKAQREVIIPLDEGRRADVKPGTYTLRAPRGRNRLGNPHAPTGEGRKNKRTTKHRSHKAGHYLSPRVLNALAQQYDNKE